MTATTTADSSSMFERLETALRDRAGYRVNFDRDDSDSFSITFTPLGQADLFLDSVTKADVLPLLPSGSRWKRAVGWRSFTGIPCRFNNTLWLALGLTVVREHDTRGAYPVSRFYFLDFQDANIIGALNAMIGLIDCQTGVEEGVTPAHGGLMGQAETPEEHRETETWILNRARAAYRRDQQLLFRTALMSGEEVPSLTLVEFLRRGLSQESSPLAFRQFLYCTIPSIYDVFSWQQKLKVFLELDLTADITRQT